MRQYSCASSSCRTIRDRRLCDRDQNDRQVAGYAVLPKRWTPAAAAYEDFRGRAQRRVGVDHAVGKALKEVCVAGVDPKMAKLHLRLCPSQRGRAVERHGVMMAVREIEHFPREGRSGSRTRRARWSLGQPHMATKAENRIEHRADGVAERPTRVQHDRSANSAPAP